MERERIQSINPDRIRWCCNDFGITPEQLAFTLNIPLSSMERVMNRDDGLTFPQLRKVAAHFGRGVLFFLEEGAVDAAGVHTPQFRTLANEKPSMSPKLRTLIERVERQRDVYVGLREDLEESVKPWSPPQALTRQDPIGAARIAREWLALAIQNNFDTYRAAVEGQGALVFLTNGYNGKWQIAKENPILGFSLYDATCPVIVIKKQRWEPQQCFTLMHELGHLLLHKTSSIDDEHDFYSSGTPEIEANSFAGHLLVPDEVLNSISDADRPARADQYDDWLDESRRLLGVSGEAILRRLLDAGRLSQAQYASYRQWRAQFQSAIGNEDGGSRKYRHREPLHIFGNPFVRTVFDALSARRITLTRASTYLDDLKIDDLHQLERHAGI